MGFLDRAREKAEELSKKAKPMAEELSKKAKPMAENAMEKAKPYAEKARVQAERVGGQLPLIGQPCGEPAHRVLPGPGRGGRVGAVHQLGDPAAQVGPL